MHAVILDEFLESLLQSRNEIPFGQNKSVLQSLWYYVWRLVTS